MGSALCDNGDLPGPGIEGVGAFAYADLGEGPGEGLRLPFGPPTARPLVGDG